MSRLALAQPAARPSLPARALLSGPAGSGKTRSALIVAEVLAEGGPILMIDTEKRSGLTYADDFTFTHIDWQPPYDPRELGRTLADARDYAVVIVDSLSHFWRGQGGVLDIAGGKFTGWKDARPAHMDLVEAMLVCQGHFIGCARSKMEHVQEMENGKHVVKKLGMAVVQDDELEYELNVAVEMDMTHAMAVSKSRTVAVPVGRTFTAGHAEEFAVLYRDWLKGGEPPAPPKVVADIRKRVKALPERERRECGAQFLAQIGRPEHLRASQIADAETMVARFEAEVAADGEHRDVEVSGSTAVLAQATGMGQPAGVDAPQGRPTLVPDADDTDPPAFTRGDFDEALTAAGKPPGRVMLRARKTAESLGEPVPAGLDAIKPGVLLDSLVAWLRGEAA